MGEYEHLRKRIDARATTPVALDELEREIIDPATDLDEDERAALWLYAEAVCAHAEHPGTDQPQHQPDQAIHD
jgi:hypothetical protein